MTEKKIKRFDMRLSESTLEKLKLMAFSENLTMSQFVEKLILTSWDDQVRIDDFLSYMGVIP